ncbi:hypothetical protein HDU76_011671, partial [Blyttiomyces sp. JEL0837]
VHAGDVLGSDPHLSKYHSKEGTEGPSVVLALPRGGLPVAFPIAKKLQCPLDLLLVRKLGYPGFEEVAMGAISVGNIIYRNPNSASSFVSESQFRNVVAKESAELERRNQKYRNGAPPYDVKGKNVIIVDDGIATGATMTASVMAIKAMGPRKIIVVAPVGAPDSIHDLQKIADEVFVPVQPPTFQAVGMWYETFNQTEDDEVLELMRQAKNLGSEAK